MSVIYDTITAKLIEAFSPTLIELIDESDQHIGHAGSKPGESTHFKLIIKSAKFQNLSRVQCHKLIYSALQEELNGQVHALSIEASG
jgi:BolA protein